MSIPRGRQVALRGNPPAAAAVPVFVDAEFDWRELLGGGDGFQTAGLGMDLPGEGGRPSFLVAGVHPDHGHPRQRVSAGITAQSWVC